MGLFGISQTGKSARSEMERLAALFKGRGQVGFQRGDEAYNFAQQLRDRLNGIYQQLGEQGFGSPDEIRARADQIMPGLRSALDSMHRRIDAMYRNQEQVPGAEQTYGARSGFLDRAGSNLDAYAAHQQGDIEGTFGRTAADEAAYTKAIQDRIRQTIGAARGSTADVYGKAREAMKGLYAGLGTKAGETFDQAINRVMPGGEARTARAARAFAPMMAAANVRLRASGIDPNSPEAQSTLRQVESSRGRAMDDQLSQAISEQNQLSLGKYGEQARLAETGGRTDTQLALEQLSQDTGLSLNELSQLNEEQLRNLYARTQNDRERRNLSMNLRSNVLGQQQDLLKQRMSEELLRRGLNQDDVDRANALMERSIQGDMAAEDALVQQYGVGVQDLQRDLNTRMAAAGQQGNLMNNAYGNASGFEQEGFGASGAAQNAYRDIYQREAQNAGWLKKALVGAGVAASALIPGAGPFISPILGGGMSAAMGQFGGGFGGGYPYAGWRPPTRGPKVQNPWEQPGWGGSGNYNTDYNVNPWGG